MRISDWSSDVCSSDLHGIEGYPERPGHIRLARPQDEQPHSNQKQKRPKHRRGIFPRKSEPVTGEGPADPQEQRNRTLPDEGIRSEERRVGNESVRTCRSRWTRSHKKKKHKHKYKPNNI